MEDCFAYRNRKCSILTVKICEGIGCSFYKTEEQNRKDREKALERINSLDEYRRKQILETYNLKDGRETV